MARTTTVAWHATYPRPTQIVAPELTTDFTYDARGRLETITVDPPGAAAVTSFVYDDIGQFTRMVLPNGTALNYVYDGARRLTQVSNDSGETITFTRNALGNVTKEETKDASSTLTKTLTRTFDELGRMLTFVGAGAQTTQYGYDKNDLLKTVTDPRGAVTAYVHNGFGEVIRRDSPDTGITDYEYDAAGNLVEVVYRPGASSPMPATARAASRR